MTSLDRHPGTYKMNPTSEPVTLLDQWPGLRILIDELPKRIAALERRVSALETSSKRRTLQPAICPDCREEMIVVAETDHPRLPGIKIHELRCKGCSTQLTRHFNPHTGYGL
jgi:hypothetical protein